MRRADSLTTLSCRLYGNLGALAFWGRQDLFRPDLYTTVSPFPLQVKALKFSWDEDVIMLYD